MSIDFYLSPTGTFTVIHEDKSEEKRDEAASSSGSSPSHCSSFSLFSLGSVKLGWVKSLLSMYYFYCSWRGNHGMVPRRPKRRGSVRPWLLSTCLMDRAFKPQAYMPRGQDSIFQRIPKRVK